MVKEIHGAANYTLSKTAIGYYAFSNALPALDSVGGIGNVITNNMQTFSSTTSFPNTSVSFWGELPTFTYTKPDISLCLWFSYRDSTSNVFFWVGGQNRGIGFRPDPIYLSLSYIITMNTQDNTDYFQNYLNIDFKPWTHMCLLMSNFSTHVYINNLKIVQYQRSILVNNNTLIRTLFSDKAKFAQLGFFDRLLCANEMTTLYNFRDWSVFNWITLPIPCSSTYSCTDNTWQCACDYCDAGFHRSVASVSALCATYPKLTGVQQCSKCKNKQDCNIGTFLNYECDGTQTNSNACVKCDTTPCNSTDFYRWVCNGTQDSVCTRPYTKCSTGQYLANWGVYNDGSCQTCGNCNGITTNLVANCTFYQDTICAEPCSIGNSQGCNMTQNAVCIYVDKYKRDLCVSCPLGYKSRNNLCIPCPRGMICDNFGNSVCSGICAFPDIPTCSAVTSAGFTCTQGMCSGIQSDPYALYKHNYIENNCQPHKLCKDGYYLLIQINNVEPACVACNGLINNTIRAVTPGLFLNDPDSCVLELYPVLYPVQFKTCLNEKGYYSNNNVLCPSEYTSLPGYACSIQDCYPCPLVTSNYMFQTRPWMCEWQCIDGYTQMGDACLPLKNIVGCSGEGYSISATYDACIVQPLPWQIKGSGYTNVYNQTVTYTNNVQTSFFGYNPLVVRFNNLNITAQAKPYYSSNVSNYLTIYNSDMPLQNKTKNIKVPGKVCNIALDKNMDMYLVYCNMSSIFFMPQQTLTSVRVIGNSTSGYQEGMRDDAMFSYELYIAVYSSPTNQATNLLVLDTWNCVVRQVVIGPNGPGDFRTKSYWLAGNVINNFPLCNDNMAYPRFTFPLQSISSPKFIAFVNSQNQLCQFHTMRKTISCPITINNQRTLQGVQASPDSLLLTLEYTGGYTETYTHLGQKCPNDYTSIKGSDCSIYRPYNNGLLNGGYYITDDGTPYDCLPVTCDIGYYSSNCLRNAPPYCVQCSIPQSANGLNISFTQSGTCYYEIVAPCPMNMYLNSNLQYCVKCPSVMYTLTTNAMSLNDCFCPKPLTKSGSDCFNMDMPYLFTPPSKNPCEIYQYYDYSLSKCISCALAPVTNKTCPRGYYLDSRFNMCAICPAGTWANTTQATSCQPCFPGTYTDGLYIGCLACPPGKFGNAMGMSECTPCPAGTYNDINRTACIACTSGKYTPSPGYSACIPCPLGMYTLETGVTMCSSCQAGYTNNTNTTACTPCPINTYSVTTGACLDCPLGTYTTGVASTQCQPCMWGNYYLNDQCNPCPPGTYSNAPGTSCLKCAVGTYNSLPGLWWCSICPAGYYSSEDGSQCNICPAGTYSYYGTQCFPCGPNSYSSQPGSNLCSTCPAGLISNENRTGCIECPPGTHVDSMEGCVQCSMGFVANKSGAAVCTQCPWGTYSDPTNTYCIPCSVGYYSNVATNLCTRCSSISFGNATGLSACYTCPEGTYTSISGSTCGQCAPGTYKDENMVGCFYCSQGYYNTISGATACIVCGLGRYSNPGQTSCADCPAGTYTIQPSSNCYTCSPGYYNTLNGQSTCTSCGIGKYSSMSHTVCLTCNAGTYSTGFVNECLLCRSGTYSTGFGVSACLQCPIGQSTNISGSGITTCMNCPVNTFSYDPGVSCMECDIGSYSTGIGQTAASWITQCNSQNPEIIDTQSDVNNRTCPSESYDWGIQIDLGSTRDISSIIITSQYFCSLFINRKLTIFALFFKLSSVERIIHFANTTDQSEIFSASFETTCPITLNCRYNHRYIYIVFQTQSVSLNNTEVPSKPQALVDFVGNRTSTSFNQIVRFYQPPSTGYLIRAWVYIYELMPEYVTLDASVIQTLFPEYAYAYDEPSHTHAFAFVSDKRKWSKNFYSNSSEYVDIILLHFKINTLIHESGVFKVLKIFTDSVFDEVIINNKPNILEYKELSFVRGDVYDPINGTLYLQLSRTINYKDPGIAVIPRSTPCTPCPTGTYRSNHSWTTCMSCSICPDGTYHSQLCTRYADTGGCTPILTNCGSGQYISTAYVKGLPSSLGSQAICSVCSCPAGYFIESGCDDGVTAPVCRQCSTCYSKTFRACTLWTNTICEDLAQCRAVDKRVTYQWLLDNPSIRCEIGYHIINISGTTPICEKCPDYLLGLDGMKCSMCPGYRIPYWDGSICVCKTPTVQMTSGECMCDVGYELGLSGCSPCLNNTYSDVSLVLTDNYWDQIKQCLPCPSGTYANTQQSTCTACPHYQYRTQNDTSCKNCAAGYYSLDPTVSTCTACTTSCSLGYYSVPCPTDRSKYICSACKPLPPNAQFLPMTIYATSYQCIWQCNAGYYRGIDECKLCSTDIFCVPGKIIEPCSEIQDLTCTQDCVNATKPMFNSEWDYGCNWRCSDGYVMTVTDFIMYVEYDCVLPGSYDPYQF